MMLFAVTTRNLAVSTFLAMVIQGTLQGKIDLSGLALYLFLGFKVIQFMMITCYMFLGSSIIYYKGTMKVESAMSIKKIAKVTMFIMFTFLFMTAATFAGYSYELAFTYGQ